MGVQDARRTSATPITLTQPESPVLSDIDPDALAGPVKRLRQGNPRFPGCARAQVRVEAEGVVIDGLVEDVSRSGLFMRAPRSIEPGSSAELAIDLPG